MENKLFFILVIVCVITHIIRTIYEILKHKGVLTANKLTFVIIFTNMFALWVSWFSLCSLDANRIALPGVIQYASLILVVIGVIVFLVGLFTIKTLESYEGDLITKGIYSKIRHPMYLGFILWLFGWPLYWDALFSFVISLPFIANVLFWRHLEEKELVERFISYKEYKKTTIF